VALKSGAAVAARIERPVDAASYGPQNSAKAGFAFCDVFHEFPPTFGTELNITIPGVHGGEAVGSLINLHFLLLGSLFVERTTF